MGRISRIIPVSIGDDNVVTRPMCLSMCAKNPDTGRTHRRTTQAHNTGAHTGAPLQRPPNGANEPHFQMKLGIIRAIS